MDGGLAGIGQVLTGQLGTSPITDIPVATQLEQRIPITLELGVLSLLFAVALGVPAGVAAAVRPGRVTDWVASTVALGGLSLPHFWFGILGILIFAVHLHVLPSGGFVPLSGGIGENLLHMVMPMIVLGTGLAAVIMRQTRAAMIEALGADYVRTARAKGMREWQVIWIHALGNSLITVITVIGLQLGDRPAQRVRRKQIPLDDPHPVLQVRCEPQPGTVHAAAGVDQADDLVAIVEQRLRQEGAVLAGQAGDERASAPGTHAGPRPDRT